jgi:iron(III) transport system ATP-binding protein
MRQELLALQRKLGITTIFVTHDQEEAMTTADRMAVLDGGIVQQVGTPAELFDFPVNRFVANFVGTTNLLDGVLAADGADAVHFDAEGAGRLRLSRTADTPPPGRVSVSFRPHAMQMQDVHAARDASLLWLAGTVEAAEFLGEITRYRVRVGTAALTADQAHFGGTPKFADGTPVALGVAPSQLRYLSS